MKTDRKNEFIQAVKKLADEMKIDNYCLTAGDENGCVFSLKMKDKTETSYAIIAAAFYQATEDSEEFQRIFAAVMCHVLEESTMIKVSVINKN